MIWLVASALSHPFETSEYSYRTAVKASDKALVGLVVLEIPIPVVLEGIGVEDGDSRAAKRRKADQYTAGVYEAMAAGLSVQVDGAERSVEWKPIAHEMNGKAAEGFFLYMVGMDIPTGDLPEGGYTVLIANAGYPDEEMVYSGGASAVEPWVVKASTAEELLGDKKDLDLAQEGRWTREAGMRQFEVRVSKVSPTAPP